MFYHGFHDGAPLPALKICSSLKVIAKTRDASGTGWGYLLELVDPDGSKKRWVMAAKMLAGDGNTYRAELHDMGLLIEPGIKAKNHLITYIQTVIVDDRIRCVDRVGWHGSLYAMPDRTIGEGDGDEQVMFYSAGGTVSKFKQRGTLNGWRDTVAKNCQGNSRLVFSVSTAFASIVLHHSALPNGGIHLYGDSSTGKSSAFKVAASVFGSSDYIQSFRTTDNALESLSFIEYAVKDFDLLKEYIPKCVDALVKEICPSDSHGQVFRVAARCALIGMAGEIATQQGITGWSEGESINAAKVCFADWLLSRGGAGNIERAAMLQLLPSFIGAHGSSRFSWWQRCNDDRGGAEHD